MSIKFCVDCVSCRNGESATPFCVNSKNIDVVTGRNEGDSCHRIRGDVTKCGPQGAWWEGKLLPMPSAPNG